MIWTYTLKLTPAEPQGTTLVPSPGDHFEGGAFDALFIAAAREFPCYQ